jgi:structural maintenance of chromosome 3 (chondroitin sulfate proteoglycan 6)
VQDLKDANERTGGKREEIEAELAKVKKEISQKEKALAKLLPKWDQHRAREMEERRR